jgi:hypothetical protein
MFAQFKSAEKSANPELYRQGAIPGGGSTHLSAVIAIASYTFGPTLAALLDAAMLKEVLMVGAGAYLQLIALAWFLVAVGLIQRYMGIP